MDSRKETKFVSLTEDQLRQYLNSVIQRGKRDGALNIVEFASRIGVSPQYLGRFLLGKAKPGKKLLKALEGRAETVTRYVLPVEEWK